MLRAAVYFAPIKDGKILMLRRFNTGYADGKYSFVAGHIDGNETVSQAMVREAKEEAGIDIHPNDLKFLNVLHRKSPDREYIDFFFTASTWTGEPEIMEPDKCDDLRWFDLNKIPENTLDYIKKIIKDIQNSKVFSEYGWITSIKE